MLNSSQIENLYKEYIKNLPQLVPDGIIPVDVHFLQDLGLLERMNNEKIDENELTQYFHVIEADEKVTLFNEQFLIWIVPKMEETAVTYVLIALNSPEDQPHLEVAFTTSGVYNTPKYVLMVLQYFLMDMIETEATLTAIEKNQ